MMQTYSSQLASDQGEQRIHPFCSSATYVDLLQSKCDRGRQAIQSACVPLYECLSLLFNENWLNTID